MSPLVLLPIEADLVPEKEFGKKNSSRSYSSSNSKIFLTLLTEVVAVHVGLSAIYVWGIGLQLLLRHLGDDKSWGGSKSGSSSLQDGLKNLLQVVFGVLGDTSSSNKGVSNAEFCL